jgi:hypothetical protein
MGERPVDLPVYMVPDPSQRHENGSGSHELVCDLEEALVSQPAKDYRPDDRPKQDTMRRHAPLPEVRDLPQVVLVVEPLVEGHIEDPASQQDTRGEE